MRTHKELLLFPHSSLSWSSLIKLDWCLFECGVDPLPWPVFLSHCRLIVRPLSCRWELSIKANLRDRTVASAFWKRARIELNEFQSSPCSIKQSSEGPMGRLNDEPEPHRSSLTIKLYLPHYSGFSHTPPHVSKLTFRTCSLRTLHPIRGKTGVQSICAEILRYAWSKM